MEREDCAAAHMKENLKESLNEVHAQIGQSIATLDNENFCLLSRFAAIVDRFTQIQRTAASFYLKCYLSSFTDKYTDLAISIQHLSERRHGALIVVRRSDQLDSLIHPGIPVGATFTFPLLESIFYPGSPLHDGAVLIEGNQIVSAAHVLPLSSTFSGEKKLGTRHRAALGLTEQCDALVVVISEETGGASFSIKGHLYPINVGEAAQLVSR